jgi:hypothetical protein
MQDYFWNVFHKYYNLICIFICTPICTKILILAKSGCYIIDRKVEVAYQLELPPQLSDVHDVFHVSQLKKYL